MKKTLSIVLLVAILLAGIVVCLGNYMLNVAVHPEPDRRHDIEGCYAEMYDRSPEMRAWHDSLVHLGRWRDTMLVAADGLKRHAIVLQHDTVAHGATLVLHGHNDNAVRMMRYAYLHYEILGRNVVVPDHFGHGESEGDHVRFAWLDRRDVAQLWIPTTHACWPQADIVVHGLSMGGAMTMYTSGEDIPETMRVKGFIEDCGYSSIWDELVFQLNDQFGLPPFPLLHAADWLCFLEHGWRITDGETAPQLARCTKPMLFIHGDADGYVPTQMVMTNYEAKTQSYKELWITEGSDHAESIHDHWEEYCERCEEFINRIYAIQ